MPPSQPSAEHLARFLIFVRQSEGLSYASVCLHKSVVVTFADPEAGQALGAHPLVRQTLKALQVPASLPPRLVWKVDDLVSWLRLHPPPSEDSFYEVSRHVAVLLLLASGRRVHDLTLLAATPPHLQDLGDSLVLWPIFGSKTDSASHRQSGWKLMPSPSDPLFDVVAWVRKLVQKGRVRAGSLPCSALFLTTRGKVAPASRTVIAGWVQSALAAAGIVASAGSFRAAVGSRRLDAGCPLDEVLRRGNWSSSQTFLRHYYRPVAGSSGPLPPIVSDGVAPID